jgi:hypothetical protein
MSSYEFLRDLLKKLMGAHRNSLVPTPDNEVIGYLF